MFLERESFFFFLAVVVAVASTFSTSSFFLSLSKKKIENRIRYVEPTIEHCRRNYRTVIPLPAVNQVTTLTRLLSGALARWLGPEALSGDGAAAAAVTAAQQQQQQQQQASSSSSSSSSSSAADASASKPAAALDKRVLEAHFVWACVWAFGGALLPEASAAAASEGNSGNSGDDSSVAAPSSPSHADAFARWWVAEWSSKNTTTSSSTTSSSTKNSNSNSFAVPFPEGASPFDCFVDPRSGAMTHWASALDSAVADAAADPSSSPASSSSSSSSSSSFLASAADDAEAALFGSARFVVTVEAARLLHVLRTLVAGGFPVLLAGGAGVGKSALLREALRGGRSVFVGGGGGASSAGAAEKKSSNTSCAAVVGRAVAASSLPLHPLPDPPAVNLVPLSACTSAADLQTALEAPLERKGGTRYGPTAAALS